MVKNFTYKTSNKIWTRVLVLLFLIVSLVNKSWGQTSNLFISEYIEGSSNNKYIEIYNGTGTTVNLANYVLKIYANGSASGTSIALSGSLPTCSVYVIENSSEGLGVTANLSSASLNFNGDDAVTLETTAGVILDVVGNIGCDPGTGWTSGSFSTLDKTLVRNASVCSGVGDDGTTCPFPSLASEWTQFNVDVISNLGSHTITCASCIACTAPTTTISPTTQTVCAGSTATINVGTSAASPSYTWQASSDGSTGWANVVNGTPTGASYSGATTGTLSITAGATYYYRCLVTDGSSTCVATSGTSTLVVNSAPTITTQTTPSSSVVCAGTATSFSVGATGTSLSYQWQVSTGGAFSNASGGAYTNGTTNRLNIGTSQATGVYTFQCIISNSCGTLTSTPVTLTVAAIPAMPITPTVITTCVPAVVSETVVGTPPAGVTWYWQTSSTATSTLNPASVDYTLTATANVFVRALSSSGCWNNTPTTSSVAVTVTKSPTITTQPSNTFVCQGNSVSTKVTMNGGTSTPVTFQWQENTGSGFVNINLVSPYSVTETALTSALVIDNTKPVGTYTYQCIVSNSCGTVTTSVVTVTISTVPAMPVTPTVITTCVPAVVSETVVGTPPADVTWYWQTSSTATSTLNPASVDYTLTATANVFVRALHSGGCWNNTPTTSSVAVTVTKSPTITTQPSNTFVCQGNSISTKVTMNGGTSTPVTFQWQENTGSGFVNINLVSPYSVTETALTSALVIDNTKPVGTYTYQCIVSNSCGTVTTSIVTVTITATPANDLCSNAISLSAGTSTVGSLNCASATSPTLTNSSAKNDVWYSFTPTCTAIYTITMSFSGSTSTNDLDLYLYNAMCPISGSATALSEGTTSSESIIQTLAGGATYYIRITDFNTTGISYSVSVNGGSCLTDYTVTFNANGGTGTMPSQTSGLATNLNANTFTNSGCFFIAWNTAADGSGTFYANGSVYSFTANITLYAQWNCSGGASFSCTGAIGNGKTQGCGDTGAGSCDLSTIGTYLDGVACGTAINASCTGACDVQAPFSRQFTVPAGCTATITAEMKVRASGCVNSGMDSGDLLSITNSGGSVISQTATLSNGGTVTGSSINKNSGTGNADGWAQMIITGGNITVSGSGQRGDEIVTYTVNFVGSCGSGCNAILPITLLDFYGVQKGNTNELVWRVAEEENIKRYVIEKSSNGVDFIHMIGVYPTEGSYNKTYRTEDVSPYSGITYYRLVTMENDYSLQYHKTIYLESNTKKWSYYYYQTGDNLNIEFKNTLPENAIIGLYDMSGQILKEEHISNSNAVINTSNIASGIYFVRISNPYKTENFKVVISK